MNNSTNEIWEKRKEEIAIANLLVNPNPVFISASSSNAVQAAVIAHNHHVAFQKDVTAQINAQKTGFTLRDFLEMKQAQEKQP